MHTEVLSGISRTDVGVIGFDIANTQNVIGGDQESPGVYAGFAKGVGFVAARFSFTPALASS
jgi:hypothetical protein